MVSEIVLFTSRARLFSRRGNLRHPSLFFFDAFFLVCMYFAIQAFQDLAQFSAGASVVIASRTDFGLLGSVGFYGVRISSYIALFRGNRMPQTVEWCTCLTGLVFALICLAFSGEMVKGYAGLKGFAFCYHESDSSGELVFTSRGFQCPAPARLH